MSAVAPDQTDLWLANKLANEWSSHNLTSSLTRGSSHLLCACLSIAVCACLSVLRVARGSRDGKQPTICCVSVLIRFRFRLFNLETMTIIRDTAWKSLEPVVKIKFLFAVSKEPIPVKVAHIRQHVPFDTADDAASKTRG